jgi:hypothetical protein
MIEWLMIGVDAIIEKSIKSHEKSWKEYISKSLLFPSEKINLQNFPSFLIENFQSKVTF